MFDLGEGDKLHISHSSHKAHLRQYRQGRLKERSGIIDSRPRRAYLYAAQPCAAKRLIAFVVRRSTAECALQNSRP
jgi:hypothetical protein